MHHVRPLAREPHGLVLVDPDAVRQRRALPRDPHRVEVRDLLHPRGAKHGLAFHDRLGGVRVDLRAEQLRQLAGRAQQRTGAARHETRREADPQPVARGPVPAAGQALRLGQRRVRGLRQLERRSLGVCVHETLPHHGAEPDALERPERRVRVMHRLHVEDRRRAAEQQLGGAEHRRPEHGLLGVRRLERPDAAAEPLLEPQLVRQPAKQRLAEVDVSLDETWDDETAAAVAHLHGRLLPASLFPLPRPFPRPLYRSDASAGDEDVRPRDSPTALVQQHVAPGEDQIGRRGPGGAQVLIRGCTAVESSEMSKYARSSSIRSSFPYTPVRMRSGPPGSMKRYPNG